MALKYIKYIIGAGAIYSGAKSAIDNLFRKQVKPEFGSIVFCTLLPPLAEHSGVYVGENTIVHLNSKGDIEKVSLYQFLNRTPAISIYVSSKNGKAVGNEKVGKYALAQVGKKRNYNVVTENCHKFSSSCLTQNQNNNDILLTKLQSTTKQVLGADQWLVWDR